MGLFCNVFNLLVVTGSVCRVEIKSMPQSHSWVIHVFKSPEPCRVLGLHIKNSHFFDAA